jgi:hypothetical protein
MEQYNFIKIQEQKELMMQAAEWFHQKWNIPKEAYMQWDISLHLQK